MPSPGRRPPGRPLAQGAGDVPATSAPRTAEEQALARPFHQRRSAGRPEDPRAQEHRRSGSIGDPLGLLLAMGIPTPHDHQKPGPKARAFATPRSGNFAPLVPYFALLRRKSSALQ